MAPEASGDYLELFDALWEAVASVERDWVLFKPEGFHPTQGFAGELRCAMQNEPDCHVFAVRSQERGYPADEWAAYAKDLRGTLCQPRDPGLLLARRSWLMQQPWRPADMLELLDLDSAGAGSQRRRCRCRRHAGRLAGQDPGNHQYLLGVCELGKA